MTTVSGNVVFDVRHSIICDFVGINDVGNMEYKYCVSKPRMKVDPTHINQGRVL